MNETLGKISIARRALHDSLVQQGVVSISSEGIASMADRSQASSKSLGLQIALGMGAEFGGIKLKGQTLGAKFEAAIAEFLSETMSVLSAIRPGRWTVECVGGKRKIDHLAKYEPYRHLDDLARAIEQNPMLEAAVGNLYAVSPDVLVVRAPESDENINKYDKVVDKSTARLTTMREENNSDAINLVHAVISCKFTMRSDRAQNARSEALNVIRNRKGRAPHVVAVTAEPSPSRLASLALGTGDIDTVYHVALPELQKATYDLVNDEAMNMLSMLIEGKRLRDISDMPLDFSV